jgi:hypothetical protein
VKILKHWPDIKCWLVPGAESSTEENCIMNQVELNIVFHEELGRDLAHRIHQTLPSVNGGMTGVFRIALGGKVKLLHVATGEFI